MKKGTDSGFYQDMDLDQVFMADEKILEKIVDYADLEKTETVLEIGTGSGNLTKALARKAKNVITIEIDERLKPALKKELGGQKNVKIIWGNALELIENVHLGFDKVISNPPYSISEPLIKTLFGRSFKLAILTMPWRFVERLTATPEEHAYSKLSLFAQSFFRIETLMPVNADAWSPRPDTKSFIIRLSPKKPADDKDMMLRELILQDDKKLKNALREAMIKSNLKSGHEKGTKRIARNAIDDIGFSQKMLEKKISEMGLGEIREVKNKIENLA
jgi:16S rRNA (adenine1518-N6/adenine1519-N6)-dimethyltransferase